MKTLVASPQGGASNARKKLGESEQPWPLAPSKILAGRLVVAGEDQFKNKMWSSTGSHGNTGNTGGDDDMYDYDYSVDLNSGNSFGFKAPPGSSLGAQHQQQPGRLVTGQAGRMMTGQAGRMMTGQASRMGTSGGGGPGDLRPMTSVSGAGYQVS